MKMIVPSGQQISADLSAASAVGRHLSSAGVPRHGTFRRTFRVLVHTRCPAVLVELGFLSNPAEARQLADPTYRSKLAQAVANGIRDFLAGK